MSTENRNLLALQRIREDAGTNISEEDLLTIERALTIGQAPTAVHWECDCVPNLGPSHCHACSEEEGREVPWSETTHGLTPKPTTVPGKMTVSWAETPQFEMTKRLSDALDEMSYLIDSYEPGEEIPRREVQNDFIEIKAAIRQQIDRNYEANRIRVKPAVVEPNNPVLISIDTSQGVGIGKYVDSGIVEYRPRGEDPTVSIVGSPNATPYLVPLDYQKKKETS